MNEKDNIVGVMKQNYTKHVCFSFFNLLTLS